MVCRQALEGRPSKPAPRRTAWHDYTSPAEPLQGKKGKSGAIPERPLPPDQFKKIGQIDWTLKGNLALSPDQRAPSASLCREVSRWSLILSEAWVSTRLVPSQVS